MKGMGPTTARRRPKKDRARRGGLPGSLGARDWGYVPFTRDASVPAQGYMASYSPAAARDGRARPARSAGRKKWSGLARDVTLNGAPLRPVKRHIPGAGAGREKGGGPSPGRRAGNPRVPTSGGGGRTRPAACSNARRTAPSRRGSLSRGRCAARIKGRCRARISPGRGTGPRAPRRSSRTARRPAGPRSLRPSRRPGRAARARRPPPF